MSAEIYREPMAGRRYSRLSSSTAIPGYPHHDASRMRFRFVSPRRNRYHADARIGRPTDKPRAHRSVSARLSGASRVRVVVKDKRKPLKFEAGFADKAVESARWANLFLQALGTAKPGDEYRYPAEQIAGEQSRRFLELYEHYGIDKDGPYSDTQLLIAVANDKFPGFDVHMPQLEEKRSRGRPVIMDMDAAWTLVRAVAAIDIKTGCGIKHATAALSKRKGPYFGISPLTLRRQFYTAFDLASTCTAAEKRRRLSEN